MIKQFVPQEFCLRCKGCCRFAQADSVWLPCLLDEEIQVLIDKKDIPACSISKEKRILPVASQQEGGFLCAFLNAQGNKCKIYALRPFECQLYPFLINLRGKRIVLTVDLNCPYIRENIKNKEFKDYCDYLAAYLNSPQQIRMLKDNPQIVQAYEEVSEIIELKISNEPGFKNDQTK